jgi:hypothetical protein
MTGAEPTADKRLQAAHARVAAAKSALEAASKAAEKGRGFLADVGLEVVAHLRRHEEAAASRAAALREAMKLGDAKPFPTAVAPAKDRLQRLEAEDRQAVAKRVLNDLVGEEQVAQREVDEAVAELHGAARGVLSTEIEIIVSRVVALELESMAARIELEGAVRSGNLGWSWDLALSDQGKRLLAINTTTDIAQKNAPEWARANESAEAWRARYEALITNHAARRSKEPAATRVKESASA